MTAHDLMDDIKGCFPKGYSTEVQNQIIALHNQYGDGHVPFSESNAVLMSAKILHNMRNKKNA